MKKSSSVVIAIIVLIILVGGGLALFHKSNKPASSTGSTSSGRNLPSVNNAFLITKTNSSVGQYLADPSGNALYTYNSDTNGVSNCTGSCLATWPAYLDKGSNSNLPSGISTIKRADNGQTQFTYNGLPLYYFTGDTSGQVTGNGVMSFSVAKPASTSSSSQSSSPPSTKPSTQSGGGSSSGYSY